MFMCRILRSLTPLAETQLRSEVSEKARLEGSVKCTVEALHVTQPKLYQLQEDTTRPGVRETTPNYTSEQPFLNPPFTKQSVAISTNTGTHPLPAISSHTPSCLPPRPTPFHSKLRPPSSSTRPGPTPHTPTCRRRHDNIPLTLPSGIMRSGGGGVLRRSAKSNTCHRSHKVIQHVCDMMCHVRCV